MKQIAICLIIFLAPMIILSALLIFAWTNQTKDVPMNESAVTPLHAPVRVTPKNASQQQMLKALRNSQITVILAPAGTGKTFLTMHVAGEKLVKHQVDKLILTRPAVGMGRTIGLLKGDLREKFTPFLAPLIEAFTIQYGKVPYEKALASGAIEMLPLEYVRGRNISGICILDEAQNTTEDEMYALLTRVTEQGKLIILGDISQTDMGKANGLSWLFEFIKRHQLYDIISIVRATSDDIVRGAACKRIVQAREYDHQWTNKNWKIGLLSSNRK